MRKQRLISAALALLLALSLCACEGGKPEPGTTGTTAAEEPGTTAPAGPLSVSGKSCGDGAGKKGYGSHRTGHRSGKSYQKERQKDQCQPDPSDVNTQSHGMGFSQLKHGELSV